MFRGIFVVAMLGVLFVMAGCNDDKTVKEKVQKPEVVQEITKAPVDSVFSAGADGKWIAFKGNTVTKQDGFLVMTSSVKKPVSGGQTQGVYVILSKEIESVVSGKEVRVTVIARKSIDPAAEFAVAYSTAQSGNSQWQKFVPTADFTPYSFTYKVAPQKSFNTDFIGIWADTSGSGKGVDIKEMYVEVVK